MRNHRLLGEAVAPEKMVRSEKQIGDMALAFGKRPGKEVHNGCVRNVPAKGSTGGELAEVTSLGWVRDLSLMVWTAPRLDNGLDGPRWYVSTITNQSEKPMMKVTTVGIDLAKDIFRVHGCNARGRVVVSKSLTRHEFRVFMVKLPPCLVGMEACHTAHYWAHELQKFGHQVKLMAPRFIRPYVKNNKNDTRDAEAICEAVTRPTMRFVPIKSRAQLDVQAVHRVRQQVVRERAALDTRHARHVCPVGLDCVQQGAQRGEARGPYYVGIGPAARP